MIKHQSRRLHHVLKLAKLGVITSLLSIACSAVTSKQIANNPSTSSTDCQTIIHELGKTTICSKPKKIVALGPNILELLLALEVQPIGYGDYFPLPYSKFDKPQQQIPFLGKRLTNQPINVGTADEPSLETIAKLQPDLIIGNANANGNEYALLSQIAPTVLFDYTTDDKWKQQLQKTAAALGQKNQAETIIADQEQLLNQVRTALQPIANTYPKMLMLGSNQLNKNLQIDPYNHSSSCSSLVEDLGFELVFPPNSNKQTQAGGNTSIEILLQLDADLIIVQAWNSDFSNLGNNLVEHQLQPVKKQWKENAIAQSMNASKQGRVYFTSAYLCRALPGPIGAKIFLEELQQKLLSQNTNDDKP